MINKRDKFDEQTVKYIIIKKYIMRKKMEEMKEREMMKIERKDKDK